MSAIAAPVETAGERDEPLVVTALVQSHFAMAAFFMFAAMTWGFLISLEFIGMYPFEGIEWLSYGRVRMMHTNEVAYGFLVNAFVGCLYYAIPRLTGHGVASRGLGWFIFWVWQFVVLATSVGQLLGFAQGVEWGETPTGFEPGTFNLNYIPVDGLIAVGALLLAVQFMKPIASSLNRRIYVSLWYFSAGIVWLILTYLMGNILPEWSFAGSSGAATAGLFIHDLVGLFVTPMGWGLMYFFVPIILRRPIWSHALSVIGFWALAFFYPLNGVHHFLLSPIPDSVEYGAIISTMAVEVVVTTVVVNFFATMWGHGRALVTNLPIRWFYTGMVFYFITCLQCAFHTTITFQEIIHFTDWVPGHAHMVMLGVFGFWMMGAITWLWPRLTGNDWYNRRLNHWHYWLTLIGLVIMIIDLTCAGLVHGFMFKGMADWMEIIRSLKPFWLARVFAGGMVLSGTTCWVYNLWMTARTPKPYDYRVDLVDPVKG